MPRPGVVQPITKVPARRPWEEKKPTTPSGITRRSVTVLVDSVLEARAARWRWGTVAAISGAMITLGVALLAFNVAGSRDWVISKFRIAPAIAKIDSIAVLPLENLSGDKAQEYFADGMTEELITELGQVSSLRVISRTSVMRYKQTKKPLPEIAEELNVQAIVEGSVLRSENWVRVTVNLIDAKADRHLWSHSCESDLQDVLKLQSLLAHDITAQIQVSLTPKEKTRLTRPRPVNPEAHEAYLKGRYFWSQRTAAGLKKSLDYFQQAIDKDPNYAVAYSGLADSYAILANNKFSPPEECYPRARVAALRGLELDGSLAEAHTSLAYILWDHDWDWSGATNEFQRANELNPSYATAHHWHAMFLSSLGRHAEAISEIRKAQELDPLSIRVNANVAFVFYFARRYDEALQELRRTLELDPDDIGVHHYMAYVYAQKGMFKEAIAASQRARDLTGGNDEFSRNRQSYLLLLHAYVYAFAGRRSEALQMMAEATSPSTRSYIPPESVARVYAGLGDKENAFVWLEKAYAEHSTQLTWLKVDPALDSLRADPRYQDLLRRMNFPP